MSRSFASARKSQLASRYSLAEKSVRLRVRYGHRHQRALIEPSSHLTAVTVFSSGGKPQDEFDGCEAPFRLILLSHEVSAQRLKTKGWSRCMTIRREGLNMYWNTGAVLLLT